MKVGSQTSAGLYVLRNPVGENEWKLQDECTKEWSERGLRIPGIGQLALVAFEVMFPSWRINEQRKPPWTPSIDFLFLNETNQFVLLEMKCDPQPVDLLQALCQVSTMAIELRNSFTAERMISAHSACIAKAGNRAFSVSLEKHSIKDRINHIDLSSIYRIVASDRPEVKCRVMIDEFNRRSHAQIACEMLTRYTTRSHFELFSKLPPEDFEKLRIFPVRYLTIQGPE